jgi:Carboxypeptidase regulatory-like domain
MSRGSQLFIYSAVALAASASRLPAQALATVRGRVTGALGEAVMGASVSVTGTQRSAIARADGCYQLTVPAGRYELRAQMVGYVATIDSVTVEEGQVAIEELRLTRATTTDRKTNRDADVSVREHGDGTRR